MSGYVYLHINAFIADCKEAFREERAIALPATIGLAIPRLTRLNRLRSFLKRVPQSSMKFLNPT